MTQRILLADDSVTIRKVVELTFSDEDFRIPAVGDGAQALESARTERPDIVISDVSMPGINGYELCERIRSDEALRGVPCLLLRGAEGFAEARAGACGAAGIIVKPFEAQEMIRKVKELLAAAAQKAPVAAPPAVRPAAAPLPPSLPVQPPAPPRAAAAAVFAALRCSLGSVL